MITNQHEVNECDDQFHEMLGTVSMHCQHSVRSDLLRPHMGHSLTFSVLETPYVHAHPDQE